MYDYLLKLEAYELAKKTPINWERLMQLRHLKDRMIRKCQRLGNVSTGTKKVSQGGPFVFQSLVAPSDFRLKEMEKWFREQQKRVAAKSAGAKTSGKAGPPQSSSQALVPSSKAVTVKKSQSTQQVPDKRQQRPPSTHREPPQSRRSSYPTAAVAQRPPTEVFSPPPLPILLVAQREEYGLDPSPVDLYACEDVERPDVSDPPTETESPGADTSKVNSGNEPEPGQLRRRRSCIKRNSMSELVKRVSWSDAQDLDQQLSRYAAAAKQVHSSETWTEVRNLYMDQIFALNTLQDQVREGLDQIRVESDHLLRVEAAIQRQRGALEDSFKDFEHKHSTFQLKVQEAINEATENLTNANLRLELPAINEHS